MVAGILAGLLRRQGIAEDVVDGLVQPGRPARPCCWLCLPTNSSEMPVSTPRWPAVPFSSWGSISALALHSPPDLVPPPGACRCGRLTRRRTPTNSSLIWTGTTRTSRPSSTPDSSPTSCYSALPTSSLASSLPPSSDASTPCTRRRSTRRGWFGSSQPALHHGGSVRIGGASWWSGLDWVARRNSYVRPRAFRPANRADGPVLQFVLLGYLAMTFSIAFSGAYGYPDYQVRVPNVSRSAVTLTLLKYRRIIVQGWPMHTSPSSSVSLRARQESWPG